METLLSQLREATKASHEKLDSAFGSLDLSQRGDYIRFLSGHALGVAPSFASFRSFVEDELGMPCPDYPAMLRQDLAELGVDADALSPVDAPQDLSPPAAGYVISGSRLGLSMIARKGYWGRDNEQPSAYMDDQTGLAIWKEAAARLKQQTPDGAQAARIRADATAVFDIFRAAFAASAATASG